MVSTGRTFFQETEPRNFSPHVFFLEQRLLLVSVVMTRNNFDSFVNIRGDIGYFRCLIAVNDAGCAMINTLVRIRLLVSI